MEQVLLLGEKINLEDFADHEVVGIVSGKREEDTGDLPVYAYDYLLNLPANLRVIIVDDNWEFELICEFHILMLKPGLHIGSDYIYHSMMGGRVNANIIYKISNFSRENFYDLMSAIIGDRELVILYGNCQIQVLIDMISNNKEFRERYVTCTMPKFWEKEDEEEYKILFESGVLRMAKYLFTQEVSVRNRFGYLASTEYVISQLSDECQIVTIANLYFEGYFPQLKNYGGKIDWWKGKFPTFGGYTDREVLKLIIEGKEDREILEEISSLEYYSLKSLKREIEDELERFQLRETSIDIKMADYLKDNYNKFLMFVTVNHPTKTVLIEFARRILNKLDIGDSDVPYDENEIPCQMPNIIFAIYPSVLYQLNLRERKIPFEAKLNAEELILLKGIDKDLDQFICKKKKKENNIFHVNLMLDFKEYMEIYIRTLRSAIHI